MKHISVILPCHNRAHMIGRVLLAFEAQVGDTSFEVVAVDDASSDDTLATLQSYVPKRYSLEIARLPENRGPGAARNAALGLAQGKILVFVGDDILPETDFIRGHAAAHEGRPSFEEAVLGRLSWGRDLPCNTLMTHIDGVGAQQFSYYYLRDGEVYDFRHFYTSNVSVKRALLDKVKYWFDPDFTAAAFEDVELAYRLTKFGMRIGYWSSIRARHYHYHTIWSFARRQYSAGLMARVLLRKHPELSARVGARTRMASWVGKIGLITAPIPSDVVERVEATCLHLLSYYEWQPHPLLDELYLKVLEYYYTKGLVDGLNLARAIRDRAISSLVRTLLVESTTRFVEGIARAKGPLPEWMTPASVLTLPRVDMIRAHRDVAGGSEA